MSDEKPIFDVIDDPRHKLRNQALAFMLEGAGYAAIFFVAVLVVIYVFVGIGQLLPPESKEAPDPTPSSAQLAPELIQVSKRA
ncbi:MAG: RC-LH1 core complex protein PufX [Pseudomonadota bacterium]